MAQDHGTFGKDGKVRRARTAGEAVDLVFRGWAPVEPPEEETPEARRAAKKAADTKES